MIGCGCSAAERSTGAASAARTRRRAPALLSAIPDQCRTYKISQDSRSSKLHDAHRCHRRLSPHRATRAPYSEAGWCDDVGCIGRMS
eukprot:483488-Pleurochrysis_carterae.AAC.2